MRRVACLAALLVVLSLPPLAGSTRAQQATPVPSTDVAQPDQPQAFEPLAFGLVGPTPPAPAYVFLARFTFTSGAATGGGADPGPTMAYVESGGIVVSAQGEAYVLPGGAGDAPPFPQPIPPGADAMLQAGDALIVPVGTPTQVRNEGAEEATVLVLGVFPGDPPAELVSPGGTGLTIEPLAIGAVDELPPGVAAAALVRLTYAPGQADAAPTSSGGVLVAYLESGEIGYTVESGAATIFPAETAATPPAAGSEAIPGTETTLAAGDAVIEQIGTFSSARNPGDEPAVFLLAVIGSPEIFAEGAEVGTPAAATPTA
jgi:quercetin dioxygenase-like cupin family protein